MLKSGSQSLWFCCTFLTNIAVLFSDLSQRAPYGLFLWGFQSNSSSPSHSPFRVLYIIQLLQFKPTDAHNINRYRNVVWSNFQLSTCIVLPYRCICFIQALFDILDVVNLFCLLDINEFYILHSVHYNSISTIQSNKCTQCCVFCWLELC